MYLFPVTVVLLFLVICVTSFEHGSINSILDQRFSKKHEVHRRKFQEFQHQHNKSYCNYYETEKRFKIFTKNLKKIDLLNRNERGTAKYGVTRFSDLTEKEFRKAFLGLRPDLAPAENRVPISVPHVDLPDSFDWRDHGAVSEVKDQGFCGSCWAFCTTGNVEGQYFMKKKQLVSLSEQELVDCDKLDNGCGGGYMTNAYQSIMDLGGLETEKDYPYDGYLSDGCVYNRSLAKVDIDSYVVLPKNETALAMWLVKNGPISVGLNAAGMQFYMKGVSHPWRWMCKASKIDHGVLIVGYGQTTSRFSHKPLPYWIIKNSWGGSWGRHGYYLLYRGDGSCGIDTMATSAVIN